MKKARKRVCICPKDIQAVTGKSYRQSLRILSKIKKELNKEAHQSLTFDEFCHYTGIPYEQIDHLI